MRVPLDAGVGREATAHPENGEDAWFRPTRINNRWSAMRQQRMDDAGYFFQLDCDL
ncbi:MAG: hypothetical protein ACP5LD_01980 [Desulfomonilaceae bacterium]